MKKTGMVIKVIAALMSFALVIGAAVIIGSVSIGATDEQTEAYIPVPDIPNVSAPYPDTTSFGVDMQALTDLFPETIEMSYADGYIYVKDFGAGRATFSNGTVYKELELVDGYWTVEIGERGTGYEIVHFERTEDTDEGSKCWVVSYVNAERDDNIQFMDNVTGVTMVVNARSNTLRFTYSVYDKTVDDTFYVEDTYKNGDLDTHSIAWYSSNSSLFEVIHYNVDGSVRYCTVYTDGNYSYYFPGQGWSSNWSRYAPADAPAGYENVDETYFSEKYPAITLCVCEHTEWNDATCTSPKTCKECGKTEGSTLDHVWGEIGTSEREICQVCNERLVPEFDFVVGTYINLEESGFPYKKISEVFPAEIEVKYENGKYMVKDLGASWAEGFTSIDYDRTEISLVDGYWVYEVSEEVYNDENVYIYVCFYGEDDLWQVSYRDGIADGGVQFTCWDPSNFRSILVYLNMDFVDTIYYVGDIEYSDVYEDGILVTHNVTVRTDNDRIIVEYSADGTMTLVTICSNNRDWYYYYPGLGWSAKSWEYDPNGENLVPEGFEDADTDFFAELAPCVIYCTHESYGEADCLNPERCLSCGKAKEGSVKLGHDIVIDAYVAPTCTVTGLTEGRHCTRCNEVIVEQAEIPSLGHTEEAVSGKAPTCTETGLGDGVKCSVCDEVIVEQAEIPSLGHTEEAVSGKAPTCTETGLSEGVKCSVCDEVIVEQEEISSLGHDWKDATTSAPKTCKECGATEGEPLDDVTDTDVDVETDKKEETYKKEETDEIQETHKENDDVDGKPEGSLSDSDDDSSEDKKRGCFSSVGFGAVALIAAISAAVILRKKREE